MCGMCGLWGGLAHWSTPGARPGRAGVAVQPVAMRRAQARFLSDIAAYRGLAVRDWMHASWIVEAPSGASLVVDGVAGIWDALAQLTHSQPDPLDPGFIAFMEARQECGA